MTKQHPGRGGARKGAGRPPLEPQEKKVKTSITIDPKLLKWLHQHYGQNTSQAIEQLIKEQSDAS